VLIGERIRAIRESKDLSQGVIEERCGLLRVYISRVENNHSVPAIETLEKMARALEVPLYQLFYNGEEPLKPSALPKRRIGKDSAWGHSGKDGRVLDKFRRLLSRTGKKERELLFFTAQKLASQTKGPTRAK